MGDKSRKENGRESSDMYINAYAIAKGFDIFAEAKMVYARYESTNVRLFDRWSMILLTLADSACQCSLPPRNIGNDAFSHADKPLRNVVLDLMHLLCMK
jgi:hypothetical protein